MGNFDFGGLSWAFNDEFTKMFETAVLQADSLRLENCLEMGVPVDRPLREESGFMFAPVAWLLINAGKGAPAHRQTQALYTLVENGANLFEPDIFGHIPADYACLSPNISGGAYVVGATLVELYKRRRSNWDYNDPAPRILSNIFSLDSRYGALANLKAVHATTRRNLGVLSRQDPDFGAWLKETHSFWTKPFRTPDPRPMPSPSKKTMVLHTAFSEALHKKGGRVSEDRLEEMKSAVIGSLQQDRVERARKIMPSRDL